MKHLYVPLVVIASVISYAHADAPQAYLHDSLPQTWMYEQQEFQTLPCDDRWWESFHDATLDSLIRLAIDNNFNIRSALARIESAKQVKKQIQAGYYPNVDLSFSWNRDMTAGTVHGEHAHPTVMNFFDLGMTMNWEIDVFGRIRQQLKAQKAAISVSQADYDAVMVSLCANLAKAYFSLRMYQEQYDIVKENVKVVEEQMKLAQARYDAGLRPALDMVQARMSVISTRAALPPLQQSISSSLYQVALLCAVYPNQLKSLMISAKLPETPEPGPIGEPVNLLRRRPDVVAAEKQLAQAAALVGVAKKDFLPTLSLAISFATEGQHINQMFGDNSFAYSFVPQISWNAFDGLARNAKVAQARANMENEIESYNLAVMTAYQEVENAIASWKSASEQEILQQMLLKESKRQLELQIDRFKQGLTGFSDVVGAQATLLTNINTIIQLHGARLNALVSLYSALGGGF